MLIAPRKKMTEAQMGDETTLARGKSLQARERMLGSGAPTAIAITELTDAIDRILSLLERNLGR